MKRLFNFLPVVFLLFAVTLLSCNREKELTFNDFDKNNNGIIDEQEFEEVFTANYYDDWNRKNNDYLDDEDFYLTSYEVWDVDDDERLTEEEWLFGYDYHYGDFIVEEYEVIDIDGDGFIEYVEYEDVLNDTPFYTQWDVDASEYLSDTELAEGIFEIMDKDNDQVLDEDEYLEFDAYFLDI